MNRLSARERIWIVIASIGFALVFCYPMLCPLGNIGYGLRGWLDQPPDLTHLARLPSNGDWDMFTDLRWVAYHTVIAFHQFPFWNPYKCGGMPMLGNPETAIDTPFFLVDLAVGPTAGLYLQLFAHLAIAFAGACLMARAIGMKLLAGMVLAATFLSGSWLYLQLSMGNLNLSFAIAYWPWMFAGFYTSLERRRLYPAGLGALALALTFFEGNYVFVYAVMMLAMVAASIAIARRELWPIAAAAVIGALGVAGAAPKLIPVMEALRIRPRPQDDFSFDILSQLPTLLLSHDQDLFRAGPWPSIFAPYGASIALPFAALALVAMFALRPRAIVWLAAAVGFLALARGNTGPYSAWALLHRLPMGENLAFSSRFLFPFVFCVSVFAAEGAQFLLDRWPKAGSRLVCALLLVGLADAWTVGPPNLRYLFHNSIPHVAATANFTQVWGADTMSQTEWNEANYGALHCWGNGRGITPAARGQDQDGYRGEFYLLDGNGTVQQTLWSPNRLKYHVDSRDGAVLVINQDFYPGWRVRARTREVRPQQGLISVSVPPGSQDVELRFCPTRFLAATMLSLLAGITIAILCWTKE